MKENDKVWYACYGSNLNADRFKYYIAGGLCPYNNVEYEGCADKTLWTESKVCCFPGDLYFANASGTWGGKGVAFYDPDGTGTVFMRLYKITWGQLLDVQRREGLSARWYGNLVPLGQDEDGSSIFTFTSSIRGNKNAPHESYISLIRQALINECELSETEANEYLKKAYK